MNTPVSISTIGLDAREATVLKVAANLMSADYGDIRVLDPIDYSGSLAFIDPNSPAAHEYGTDHTEAVRVLVTSVEPEDPLALHLQRPLRVQVVCDFLIDLIDNGEKQSTPASQHIPSTTARGDQPEHGAPSNSGVPTKLLETLVAAKSMKLRYRLELPDDSEHANVMWIDGANERIHPAIDDEQLVRICRASPRPISIRPVMTDEPSTGQVGGSGRTFSDIAWVIGNVPDGSLADELDPNSPIRLTSFPRIPRQPGKLHYVTIATMLTRRSLTLNEIQAETGLDMGFIRGFFNIVRVLDIVQVEAPAHLPKRRRGAGAIRLLDKIARRLSLRPQS